MDVKEQSLRNDRLAARFGHPAIYKPLITPMVHAKAQNLLASIYRGRLSDGRDGSVGDSLSVSGYSDSYVLDNMSSVNAGKLSPSMPGFEVVPESRLDFEFYKNRDEFAADHGAGELFGTPSDLVRPGTPGTIGSGPGSEPSSRPGTPVGGMGFGGNRRAFSPYSGYMSPPPQSTGYPGQPVYPRSPMYSHGNDSGANLVTNAADAPVSTPSFPPTPNTYGSRDMSLDGTNTTTSRGSGGRGIAHAHAHAHTRAPGMLGGGPQGYGGLPQTDDLDVVQSPPLASLSQDPTQYDYFRGGRRREGAEGGGATPGAATRGGGSGWGGN